MSQFQESIGQKEKQIPQGERLVPTTVKRLSFPDVGDVNIVHLKVENGKNKALVAVGTSFDHLLPYEPGAPETAFQGIRKSTLGKLAMVMGAAGFILPVVLPSNAQSMEAEDVPQFEPPQPASWSIPGDSRPNISEMDGEKILLFHRNTAPGDRRLHYVSCDDLEECLSQVSPQSIEGIQDLTAGEVLYAYIYENINGEYILRWREGNSVFERPVSFINGVLTATGDKTQVTIPPESGSVDNHNTPHVIRSFSNTSFDERSVKNLHTGEITEFQARTDGKGLTEANVCGIPHYCRYNAKAIGSRLRELHGGTQLCDLVVADSYVELINSVHRLDTSTFPPAHKPKNPRLMDNVLIYTSEVAPGPGEEEGRRIWYAIRIDQEPPENPYIENIDINGDVNPVDLDYGTDEETAISRLNLENGTMHMQDSDGNEYLVQLHWTIINYSPDTPGQYFAVANFVLPNHPETGEQLQWGPEGEQTVSTEVTVNHATIENIETIGNISVPHGTSEAEVRGRLPQTIEITDNAGGRDVLPVSWNMNPYNPEVPGAYEITGSYTLPDKYEPPREREVTVTVTVEEQENPDLPTLAEVLDGHIVDAEFGYGTSGAEVLNQLQTAYPTIEIVDSEGGRHTADLEWSLSGWNEEVQGTYLAIGTIRRRMNPQGEYEFEFGGAGQREVVRNASNLPSAVVDVLIQRAIIRVDHGTPSEELLTRLPLGAKLLDELEREHSVPIEWDLSQYNPEQAGQQRIIFSIKSEDIPTDVFGENNPGQREYGITVREAPDPCEFAMERTQIDPIKCEIRDCNGELQTFFINCEKGRISIDMGSEDPIEINLDGEMGVNLITEAMRLLEGEIEELETNGNQTRISYGRFEFGPEGTKIRINGLWNDGIHQSVEVEVFEGGLVVTNENIEMFLLHMEAGDNFTLTSVEGEDGMKVIIDGYDPNGGEEVGVPSEEVGVPSEEVGVPSEEVGVPQNGDAEQSPDKADSGQEIPVHFDAGTTEGDGHHHLEDNQGGCACNMPGQNKEIPAKNFGVFALGLLALLALKRRNNQRAKFVNSKTTSPIEKYRQEQRAKSRHICKKH